MASLFQWHYGWTLQIDCLRLVFRWLGRHRSIIFTRFLKKLSRGLSQGIARENHEIAVQLFSTQLRVWK